MARTESLSIQVHPNNEQEQINLMQHFHWSLLSSQEIKTIDNHLERRGDDIYQVRSSEHYTKLTFSRELDLPNLSEIKRIEREFFNLPVPQPPKLFPVSVWMWLVLALFWGIGVVAWIIYYFASYAPKRSEAERVAAESDAAEQRLLGELGQYA